LGVDGERRTREWSLRQKRRMEKLASLVNFAGDPPTVRLAQRVDEVASA